MIPSPCHVHRPATYALAVLCSLALSLPADLAGQQAGISGKVAFAGMFPDPEVVKITQDTEACGSEVLLSLIEGENGGLENAVVRIVGIESDPPADFPEPVLDQKGCLFEPRVILVAPGQYLEVLNSDGIMHNVHTRSEKNRTINRSMPRFLTQISVRFREPEIIPVRCDVHSWMHGIIVVAEHPFYAVTASDGSFELPSVPDGTYTLEAWHPELGTKTTTVEVTGGQVQRVEIVF